MLRETLVLDEDERADARPRDRRRPRFFLVVLQGPEAGRRVVLDRPRLTLGRGADADLTFEDDGVSRRHATLELRGGRWRLTDAGSTNGVFVAGRRCGTTWLSPGDKIGIGADTVLKLCLEDDLDAEFEQRIFDAALHDGLTGTLNRAAFDRELEIEVARAVRHEVPMSLLMFDLDHFKAVNDEHGHAAGDAVLREFAHRIHAVSRSEDRLARFGGEEFAMICGGARCADALRIAERALHAVASEPFRVGDRPLPITVSIGVAELGSLETPTPSSLVEAADAALYRAKAAGRGRVEVH